jgi:hypothetical protein
MSVIRNLQERRERKQRDLRASFVKFIRATVRTTFLNLVRGESPPDTDQIKNDLGSQRPADGGVYLLERRDEQTQTRSMSEVSSERMHKNHETSTVASMLLRAPFTKKNFLKTACFHILAKANIACQHENALIVVSNKIQIPSLIWMRFDEK